MAKSKTHFVCSECGTISIKWLGKCPECDNWNTFTEELLSVNTDRALISSSSKAPELLKDIDTSEQSRISTGIPELDRVLGGGMVKGSVTLIGGQPGIGKSTLLLQVSKGVSENCGKVLYVSGEESPKQIKMRASRLGIDSDNLYILPEISIENILEQCYAMNPSMIVIDSIQTVYKSEMESAPGSVSQVRECTAALVRMAKTIDSALMIVGHVTKDGNIAGPRVLEHLVDSVLYFEGENVQNFRIIKSVKNRFGSTNEIGIFEMDHSGLKAIKNPSEYFLQQRIAVTTGSVIIPVIEGSRAILVEVQALVTKSFYPAPARKAKGIDTNRLALIIAVLEKRAGLALSSCDIYVNVVGGIEIDEPAIDLGIAMAIVSSFSDRTINSDSVFIGELGLGGEIRGVSLCDRRVVEAERLGFKNIVIPSANSQIKSQAVLVKVTDIREAVGTVLKKSHGKEG